MANPMTNAKTYAQITGIALAAVAVLGIVLSAMGTDGMYGLFCNEPSATTCEGTAAEKSFLGFDWTHNILHVVLAAIALYVGFAATPSLASTYAKVFGIVYLGLGVVGFIQPNLAILHLELGENLVHVLIGAWGVVAGFMGTTGPTPTPTTTNAPTRRV